ncbi:dihydrofolate reductase family protein [Georgenia sp. MJ206]|uniref:dihydrofolate reductase family protein n=1 Tax=Georgenia wangjunii TaxID=3117730 RepID=UPI002F26D3B5
MRTLAITQNITLDGSIEMLGEWFDPQAQGGADNTDLLETLQREDRESDGFLVGRQTFEDLRGYWPQQAEDTTGITDHLNKVQKYVVSSTLTEPDWRNTTILSGDPIEKVRALKEEPGRDIVVTGSITLCHALIDAGLVDQYRLFVYPVVQGRGRRLFPDGFAVPKLKLLDAKAFRCASRTHATPQPDLASHGGSFIRTEAGSRQEEQASGCGNPVRHTYRPKGLVPVSRLVARP